MGWPGAAAAQWCFQLELTVASIVPSGLNATSSAPPVRTVLMGWPVAGFHSRTELSVLASILPSGLNATPLTPPWMTIWRVPVGWPLSASRLALPDVTRSSGEIGFP